MTLFIFLRRMRMVSQYTLTALRMPEGEIWACVRCRCSSLLWGGCSAIDIIDILNKQRQELKDLKITVTGEREKGAIPSLYQSVHAHYRFYGELDSNKVERAINLSIEKYCSVSKTLEKAGAVITYTFEIHPV